MPFLQRLFASARPAQRAASLENPTVSIQDADAWTDQFGYGTDTDAGETVNVTTAISLSGLWCAVKLISGDVSRMPLQVLRKQEGKKPKPDESHYLTKMIGPYGRANEDDPAIKLWRRAMVQALLFENAYIWMDWAGNRVRGFYLLLSDRTAVVRTRGRKWVITEVGDQGKISARPYDEVIHIEGLSIDNMAGAEAVQQAREDIGTALASRKFKAKFFGQGMHAGGILQVPPGADPKTAKKIENAIDEHRTTTNKAFRTLVLRDGFKWHTTQINAEQAQLTEIDEAGVRDLARRFLISPARLGVKESISYNSLAMERRDYHDTTLAYWLSIIEAEINIKALTEDERERLLVAYAANLALLFADASTLMTIGTQGMQAKDAEGRPVFERDEIRGWFGMPPLDDEDDDGQPQPDPEPEEDPDEGDDDDDDDQQRDTHRQLLAAELGRMVRRLNVHSARAAGKGPLGWRVWIQGLDRQHRDVAVEGLTPVIAACHSLGFARETDARAIAEDLFTRYRDQLGTEPAEDLPGEDLANELAAELM